MLLRCNFPLTDSVSRYRYADENDHKKNALWHSHEYRSEAESFGDQSRLHRRDPDLGSKPQSPVWPDEVVIAAKQLEMIFKTFLASCVTYRPAK
jgi:hypothetical protein